MLAEHSRRQQHGDQRRGIIERLRPRGADLIDASDEQRAAEIGADDAGASKDKNCGRRDITGE